MKSVFESPRQYQVYSDSAISLDIQLLMADGSTRGPVTLTGDSATAYTLEALVDSEGSLSTDFASCVGAWVKPSATIYWNTGLDKALVNQGGSPSGSELTTWEAGIIYPIGSAIESPPNDLFEVLKTLLSCFNVNGNRVLTQAPSLPYRVAADGVVLAAPCIVAGYNIEVAGGTLGFLYDNASAASGTKLAPLHQAVGYYALPDVTAVNGVYADVGTSQVAIVYLRPY